jgi:hypothetical protein
MRLWLDDERTMPPGFDLRVVNSTQALCVLRKGKVSFISFDHDLGAGPTGYDVACELERLAYRGELKPPEFAVHSANPVGAQRIIMAMHSAHTWWRRHSG